ncbi:MAG: hypothetical protein AAGC67_15420 [Myxococcota bacterium]
MTLPSGAHADAPSTTSLADRLAFSLWIPAAIAGALTTAVGRLLDAEDLVRWAVMTASGGFVIYGVDRLRDLERDRHTSPDRTAFIERNQTSFRVALGLAALVLVASAVGSAPASLALCASLGAVGLLHRRLKRAPAWKSIYVSLSWTGICVGLPWLAAPDATAESAAALALVLFPTFWANLVASNLRDDEAALRPAPALRFARAALVFALAAAWLVPTDLAPLAWLPVFEFLALARFRATEHYGHLAVDGALLAGALATHLQLTLA